MNLQVKHKDDKEGASEQTEKMEPWDRIFRIMNNDKG